MIFILENCSPKLIPEASTSELSKKANATTIKLFAELEEKAWGMTWENTLKEARKEGKVVMYNTRSPDLVRALREAFTKKYGIQLESVSGRGPEINEKIIREYRAGVTGGDVHFPGTTSLVNVLKPAGVLDSIEPELIFPDLTNPEEIKKVWISGKQDWVDQERMGLSFLSSPSVSFAINAELAKPEELKSYRDLLNPKLCMKDI